MVGSGNPRELFDWLLALKPTELRSWVEAAWQGNQPVPNGFDWAFLAQLLYNDAFEHCDRDLAWVVISVGERLALTSEAEPPKSLYDRHAFDAMTRRAWLIARCGAVPGDFVFDPERVVNWVRQALTMSPEEALSRWKTLGALSPRELMYNEEFRRLSHIKQRLVPLRVLVTETGYEPEAELRVWLRVREYMR